MGDDDKQPPLAERCAAQLERAIACGEFSPGQRLDEEQLSASMDVSRNTLREAFRLLARQQLVDHLPHRGVFVRTVDSTTAHHVYAVRRHLELGALEDLARAAAGGQPLPSTDELFAAVAAAEQARDDDDWNAVGTANADFHLALVRLAGNPVADKLMEPLASLMRLRFLTLGDARRVHEEFVPENRRLAELVAVGELVRARVQLEVYLVRAEAQLG